MEIETPNGTTIQLNDVKATDFGRGLGFHTNDRTVSRRHVSFKLKIDEDESGSIRAQFEVAGNNPLWIRSFDENGEVRVRVYRRGDAGEMGIGDSFCVSGKEPVWFTLRRKDEILEKLESCSGDDDGGGSDGDVLDIDPVKEFGFLVMGNEFNAYSKRMIRDITKWNWFLEQPKKDSDEEGTSGKKRNTRKKKKKTGGLDDDDEWTDESEDGINDIVSQTRKFQKTNYSTRSKNQKNRPLQHSQSSKKSIEKNSIRSYQGDEEDDDDGDTLGGFIVDDVEAEDDDTDEDDEEEEDIVDEEELDE